MAEIDVSDRKVASAIEKNFIEFFRYWGSSPLVTMKDSESICWIDSGVTFPLFNHVFFTRLTNENREKVIDETLSHFRSRRLPMLWSVFPSSKTDNLGDRLRAFGLTYHGNKPAMAMMTEDLDMDLAPPKNLRIESVQEEETLLRFVEVTARSFDVTKADARTFFRILCSLSTKETSKLLCYLGYVGDEPMATGILFNAAGVSGVYWVGTVPEARGKGIGTWMTRRIMTDGHERGNALAVLQATEMGEPVYRRIGFREYLSYDLFSYNPSVQQS